MCRPPSSDGGPVVSHTKHPVSNRVSLSRCTSAFWQVRHGAGDTAAARRFTTAVVTMVVVSRAHPPPRRRLIVQWCPTGGGEAVIPRPVVRRADSRCTSPVALPPYPPPDRFEHATVGLCWSSAGWMGSHHRPGTAPGPAYDRPSPFAPPPAIQLRSPK